MNPNLKKFIIPTVVVAFALMAYFLLAPSANPPADTTPRPTKPAPEIVPIPGEEITPVGSGPSSAMPIYDAAHADLIRVDSPTFGQLVKSPLGITGQARGTWFFEASFPVKLLDEDGTVLAQAPAGAVGDWMTTDFVPFALSLPFTEPKGSIGTLVLQKDNPSGDPAKDDEISVTVRFKDVPLTK